MQGLGRPYQSGSGGDGWRLQSDSAESRGHRRRGHRLRSRHRGRQTLLRAEIIRMFLRIVYESFRHQARRKLLAGIAITLGVAVAPAMIPGAPDIGDNIHPEWPSSRAQLVDNPAEHHLAVAAGGGHLSPPTR